MRRSRRERARDGRREAHPMPPSDAPVMSTTGCSAGMSSLGRNRRGIRLGGPRQPGLAAENDATARLLQLGEYQRGKTKSRRLIDRKPDWLPCRPQEQGKTYFRGSRIVGRKTRRVLLPSPTSQHPIRQTQGAPEKTITKTRLQDQCRPHPPFPFIIRKKQRQAAATPKTHR